MKLFTQQQNDNELKNLSTLDMKLFTQQQNDNEFRVFQIMRFVWKG